MKKQFFHLRGLLSLLVCGLALSALPACNDLGDDDYYSEGQTSNQNKEIISVSGSTRHYLSSRADLSQMNALFKEQGIYTELEHKGQLHTILVVKDDNFVQPDPDEAAYIAKSHVSDISVSPSKLNDGDRLLMWHQKYVTITKDETAQSGAIIDHILFNNAALSEVIKTDDGFIYVINEMIYTPTSLEDYINNLDDSYSVFKDMVLSSGGKTFDRQRSIPLRVDDAGNTVYDSAWIYTNDFFDAKNFNLSSEALTATMLVFSNAVIEDALRDADTRLRAWGYRDALGRSVPEGRNDYSRSDSILRRWVLEVAFFDSIFSASQMSADIDRISIYDRVWRPSVQDVDLANPINLSNGVAYRVNKFRIPNHMLIYRLKEDFAIYEYCNATEKEQYYQMDNLALKGLSTDVAPWTPAPGIWPTHQNRILTLRPQAATGQASVKITGLRLLESESGLDVLPMVAPPGRYRMAIGFRQNMSFTPVSIQLFCVDGPDTIPCADPVTLADFSQTNYHYDRGATLSNRYPEGYDVNADIFQGNQAGKKQNYDTDGGPVYDEVDFYNPNASDPNAPLQVLIRIEGKGFSGTPDLFLNHWCLRPTADNY